MQLYHERQIASLSRTHASEEEVDDALKLAQDNGLSRFSVEFRLDDEADYAPGRWVLQSGLGAAFESYVSALREMDKVRWGNNPIGGLTDQHHKTLDGVVAAAQVLAGLGWPVNWQQNVQTVLEVSEYGLRGGRLVDRFSELPERVTLSEELLLLGTVTFHRQDRSADGVAAPFKSAVLSAENRARYGNTPLYLRNADESLPARFRYSSHWMQGTSGTSHRFAI